MSAAGRGFGFPFQVSPAGTIAPDGGGDADLRGRIIQVLFTAPGERVNLPEFGCGLLNLVFDPTNPVLAAATEFTVGQALTRWLGQELIVAGVDIDTSTQADAISVEVAYVRRSDLARQSFRVHFS